MQINHSPLHNAEIKDVHTFTSTPPYTSMDRCLRDNFTFTIRCKSVTYSHDTNLSRWEFMTELHHERELTFVVGLRTSS
jgi:hypothetical protein